MADGDLPEQIAVGGEIVPLELEAEGAFVGNVDIRFSVFVVGGAIGDATRPLEEKARFQKSLPVASSAPVAGSALVRSIVNWPVDIPSDLVSQLCVVKFYAAGSDGTRTLRTRALNQLRVVPIVVTDHPDLKAIMIHEFSKADGNSFVFDPAPLQQIIDGLSVEQKKLLATYDIGSAKGRLVVFITFQPGATRLMFADNCSGSPVSVHANAGFSVFACRGPGEMVTLACHTDHFVVNMDNRRGTAKVPDTQNIFTGSQGGKRPDDWLAPDNATPPKFMAASHCAAFTDGVIWSRLFALTGKNGAPRDVMLGNSIHGILNTIGCWMLFRNYNWPIAKRIELFRIYTRFTRAGASAATVAAQLANPNVGYNVPSVSFNKYLFFDLNYAYNFFFRDLVGVSFFSSSSQFYQSFSNLHETHGRTFSNTFQQANVLTGNQFHDTTRAPAGLRQPGGPGDPGDLQWRANVLGFRTAKGFLADAEWQTNVTLSRLQDRSWADWYFFKPRSLTLQTILASPAGNVP